MKIIKKIDETLSEIKVLIYSPSEAEYASVVEKIEDRLSFVTIEGIVFVQRRDLLYIKAQKNYLEIVTDKEIYKMRSPLYLLEKRLGNRFIRVSRSFLINFDRLDKLETDLFLGINAHLGKIKVPVSKSYLKNINTKISEIESGQI
ncbi:LytTR family DNA-binding domain-containing protein [Lactococcus lactis]|uniref:LytTR family DNA-binding domain-containing protein n=1 Tax=Lactococcus lactis TaxID=1358 RepID=UPI00223AC4DD|nr:LytTR family DNA-binding domain-containing protein [Lactococcus lactis]